MSYTEPIEMRLSRVARDCSALLGGRNSHDRGALIEDLYRMERELDGLLPMPGGGGGSH